MLVFCKGERHLLIRLSSPSLAAIRNAALFYTLPCKWKSRSKIFRGVWACLWSARVRARSRCLWRWGLIAFFIFLGGGGCRGALVYDFRLSVWFVCVCVCIGIYMYSCHRVLSMYIRISVVVRGYVRVSNYIFHVSDSLTLLIHMALSRWSGLCMHLLGRHRVRLRE